MPETVTPAPVAVSTATVTSPPLMTVDAAVSAAITKAEAHAEGKLAPGETAPVVETPKPAATIAIEPESLRQITKLSRQNRELETKVKALETSTADAAVAVEAMKLFQEAKTLTGEAQATKKLEALAKLTGADPTEEMTSLLEAYMASPSAGGESALAKRVDELTAQIEADKRTRAEEAKAAATASAKATEAKEKAVMLDFAAKQANPAKHELCAKDENKSEASQAALDGVVHLAVTRKLDLAALSQPELVALFAEAYDGVEAQYEALGKRYSKAAPKEEPVFQFQRAGISTSPPKKILTIDEVVAKAEAAAREAGLIGNEY